MAERGNASRARIPRLAREVTGGSARAARRDQGQAARSEAALMRLRDVLPLRCELKGPTVRLRGPLFSPEHQASTAP